MRLSFKAAVIGALALGGSALATAPSQAMPVGPVAPAAAEAHVEQAYFYGYGYRRPFYRRFYGYRPFYGYRRFGYGYGVRRPFYGYRRFGYGYRRW